MKKTVTKSSTGVGERDEMEVKFECEERGGDKWI